MNEEVKEGKEKSKFPDKKDLIYMIILLLIIMVFIIVWRVDSPQLLSDQIALGAAIFSILLAIVGIIIPYIQGNESNRQNFQLLGEINEITKSIVGLNSLREDLSKSTQEFLNATKNITKLADSELSKDVNVGEQKEMLLNDANEVFKDKIMELENLVNKYSYKTGTSSPPHDSDVIYAISQGADTVKKMIEYLRENFSVYVGPHDLIIVLNKLIKKRVISSYIDNTDRGFTKYVIIKKESQKS